jgi:hypothetical protein
MKPNPCWSMPLILLAVACGQAAVSEPKHPDASVAKVHPDAGGIATFVVTSLAVTPNAVDQGAKASLEVDLAATGTLPLSEGELRITVQPPTGAERVVKVTGIALGAGEKITVSEEIADLDEPGAWTLLASLYDAWGELLAEGPEEGVGLTVNAVGTCSPACSGQAPICDPAANACVCSDDSCGAGLACDADSHRCTCATACADPTPDCDLSAKACVCNESSCPATEACGADGRCVQATCSPACAGETPSCNLVAKTCECTASSCGAGKTCSKGACAVQAVTDTRTIAEIVDGASRVRKFAETNKRLPTYVTLGTTQVSMASFLMLEVSAVLELKNAQTAAIPLKSFAAPAAPLDDTTQGQLPQAEFLKVALDVQSYMTSSGKAPSYASQTSRGAHWGFVNLVYSYAKILDFWGANQRLPAYVTLDLFSQAATTTTATANPLPHVVGYTQINLTSSWGSCGSHSGGVGIGYLRGFATVSQATQVESDIYWNHGGRVYGGPGRSTLASAFNSYLNAKGVPYTAYLFSDSATVLERIKAGTPVVANTNQWGGHYVCIYGLVEEGGTWKVYFSDGAYNDGLGAGLATGYLKKWNWSTLKAHVTSGYVGFKHK